MLYEFHDVNPSFKINKIKLRTNMVIVVSFAPLYFIQ